jgi:hypothetical protein
VEPPARHQLARRPLHRTQQYIISQCSICIAS